MLYMSNLILVGQLANESYTMNFHYNNRKISKGGMMIAPDKKKGILYVGVNVCYSFTIVVGNENPNLWH